MDEIKLSQSEWHKKQAVTLFNAAWELIDKNQRSKHEELDMIHMAHASRYHWGQVGGNVELARGEWQISRVYAVLGRGDSALYHGKESLRICEENNIGGFDLAFGYEAVSRAYRIMGRRESDIYKDYAFEAADKIENEDDKKYVLDEINGI